MSMSRLVLGLVAVGLVIGVLLPAALIVWARSLASSPAAPRFLRYVPVAIAVVAILNLIATATALCLRFVGLGADPAMKSQIMADLLAEAMNCFAFGTIGILAFGVILAITAIAMRLRSGG